MTEGLKLKGDIRSVPTEEEKANAVNFVGVGALASSDIHPKATIEANTTIGEAVSIGEYARVQSGSELGKHSTIWREAQIHPNVKIGPNAEVGIYGVVYEGAELLEKATVDYAGTVKAGERVKSDKRPGLRITYIKKS